MFTKKLAGICAVAFMMLSLSAVQANQWNKKTVLNFDQPVQVPGALLAPGTYVFKLADTLASRDVVQIFNKNQTKLVMTIIAIPDRRLETDDKTVLEFWETPEGNPVALRSWFYPGDNRGFEFPYPKNQARLISKRVHKEVPVLERAEADLKDIR